MFDKVLKLLLLISPIAYTIGIKPEKFELMFFHIGIMVLFIASLLSMPRKIGLVIPKGIVLMFALCVLSVAIHSFQTQSLGVLINVFFFFIGLNLVCNYMGEVNQFYKYIAWAAGINCAVWLVQRYCINFIPFGVPAGDSLALSGGIFGTTPRLFNYLAIITPILLSISPLFFIIPILSIIGKQFAPVVTTGLYLLSMAKTLSRKIVFIVGSVALLVLFHKHIFEAFRVRIHDIFPQVIIGIGQIPFIGHGLGAYYHTLGADSFNLFLLLGYDLGVIGMFALGYAIWKARKLFKINVATMSMVSVLVVSMFDYVIEIPRLWFTLMFIISSFITQEEKSC